MSSSGHRSVWYCLAKCAEQPLSQEPDPAGPSRHRSRRRRGRVGCRRCSVRRRAGVSESSQARPCGLQTLFGEEASWRLWISPMAANRRLGNWYAGDTSQGDFPKTRLPWLHRSILAATESKPAVHPMQLGHSIAFRFRSNTYTFRSSMYQVNADDKRHGR